MKTPLTLRLVLGLALAASLGIHWIRRLPVAAALPSEEESLGEDFRRRRRAPGQQDSSSRAWEEGNRAVGKAVFGTALAVQRSAEGRRHSFPLRRRPPPSQKRPPEETQQPPAEPPPREPPAAAARLSKAARQNRAARARTSPGGGGRLNAEEKQRRGLRKTASVFPVRSGSSGAHSCASRRSLWGGHWGALWPAGRWTPLSSRETNPPPMEIADAECASDKKPLDAALLINERLQEFLFNNNLQQRLLFEEDGEFVQLRVCLPPLPSPPSRKSVLRGASQSTPPSLFTGASVKTFFGAPELHRRGCWRASWEELIREPFSALGKPPLETAASASPSEAEVCAEECFFVRTPPVLTPPLVLLHLLSLATVEPLLLRHLLTQRRSLEQRVQRELLQQALRDHSLSPPPGDSASSQLAFLSTPLQRAQVRSLEALQRRLRRAGVFPEPPWTPPHLELLQLGESINGLAASAAHPPSWTALCSRAAAAEVRLWCLRLNLAMPSAVVKGKQLPSPAAAAASTKKPSQKKPKLGSGSRKPQGSGGEKQWRDTKRKATLALQRLHLLQPAASPFLRRFSLAVKCLSNALSSLPGEQGRSPTANGQTPRRHRRRKTADGRRRTGKFDSEKHWRRHSNRPRSFSLAESSPNAASVRRPNSPPVLPPDCTAAHLAAEKAELRLSLTLREENSTARFVELLDEALDIPATKALATLHAMRGVRFDSEAVNVRVWIFDRRNFVEALQVPLDWSLGKLAEKLVEAAAAAAVEFFEEVSAAPLAEGKISWSSMGGASLAPETALREALEQDGLVIQAPYPSLAADLLLSLSGAQVFGFVWASEEEAFEKKPPSALSSLELQVCTSDVNGTESRHPRRFIGSACHASATSRADWGRLCESRFCPDAFLDFVRKAVDARDAASAGQATAGEEKTEMDNKLSVGLSGRDGFFPACRTASLSVSAVPVDVSEADLTRYFLSVAGVSPSALGAFFFCVGSSLTSCLAVQENISSRSPSQEETPSDSGLSFGLAADESEERERSFRVESAFHLEELDGLRLVPQLALARARGMQIFLLPKVSSFLPRDVLKSLQALTLVYMQDDSGAEAKKERDAASESAVLSFPVFVALPPLEAPPRDSAWGQGSAGEESRNEETEERAESSWLRVEVRNLPASLLQEEFLCEFASRRLHAPAALSAAAWRELRLCLGPVKEDATQLVVSPPTPSSTAPPSPFPPSPPSPGAASGPSSSPSSSLNFSQTQTQSTGTSHANGESSSQAAGLVTDLPCLNFVVGAPMGKVVELAEQLGRPLVLMPVASQQRPLSSRDGKTPSSSPAAPSTAPNNTPSDAPAGREPQPPKNASSKSASSPEASTSPPPSSRPTNPRTETAWRLVRVKGEEDFAQPELQIPIDLPDGDRFYVAGVPRSAVWGAVQQRIIQWVCMHPNKVKLPTGVSARALILTDPLGEPLPPDAQVGETAGVFGREQRSELWMPFSAAILKFRYRPLSDDAFKRRWDALKNTVVPFREQREADKSV